MLGEAGRQRAAISTASTSSASGGGEFADTLRRPRTSIPGDASRRFVEVIASGGRSGDADANALLNSILLDATELLAADRVALMLYDAQQRTLEILDIGAPAFPGRVVHVGEGVAGRVIESGQPLVIGDYERWTGKIPGEVEGPPIVSAVAVPLRAGATPIGAMTAHSTKPGRRFTTDDAHVLEVFADIAMLALSHFSMHAELLTLNSRLERRVRDRTRALQRSTEEISRKNDQLKELILGIERTQDDERRRIAQDIHDSVLQTLSGAIFELKAAETTTDTSALAPKLGTIRGLLHQIEADLRGVVQDLQPIELERDGLVRAIENEAKYLESRHGIECRVRIFGRSRTVPQPVEVAALRIVKEALGNVQRHSSASRADVELHLLKHEIQLCVRDCGVGFDPSQAGDPREHLGITGMRRRAEAGGGSFRVTSAPGRGTEIAATLPFGPGT